MRSTIDADYDYINARLRAMRSRLFDRVVLEHLVAMPSLEALIGELGQTPYQSALEQSLIAARGLNAILRAIHVRQGAVLRRIAAFGSATIEPALEILLAPAHRETIVTLLHGVSGRSRPDQMLPWLTDVPPFSEGKLVELARQGSVRTLIDLLVQWRLPSANLAGSLQAALVSGVDPGRLANAFDLDWAAATSRQARELPGKDGDLVRRDLARALDLHNLLIALNLREIDLARPVSWLPGGRLPAAALEGMRRTANSQAMDEVLAAAPHGEFWRAGLAQWDGRYPATLQQHWERALFDWRIGLFSQADPLGVGVLIAFLAAQDAEVRNLRLAAQAVAGNIERDEARELWWLPN